MTAVAPDRADQAIAAAAAAAEPAVKMVPVDLTLPGGRPVRIIVPADISDLEWLGLMGVLPQVRDALVVNRAVPPGPRLLVPS